MQMSAAFPQADAFAANSPSLARWRDNFPLLMATAFASLPLINQVGFLEVSAFIGVALCAEWTSRQLARSAATIPQAPPPADQRNV